MTEHWQQWRADFGRYLSGEYAEQYYLPFTVSYLRRFLELGEQQAARLSEAERLLRLAERASDDELRAEEIGELYEDISEFLRAADSAPLVHYYAGFGSCSAVLKAARAGGPMPPTTDVEATVTCPDCRAMVESENEDEARRATYNADVAPDSAVPATIRPGPDLSDSAPTAPNPPQDAINRSQCGE